MTPDRLAEIRALLVAKRVSHPELSRRVSWSALKRILKREGVSLFVRPHPRLAQLMPCLGAWSIVVDSRQPKDAWLICAAHELGHLYLHHDPLFSRWETSVYDKSPPWYDALREEEADAFAELLVRGPRTPNQQLVKGRRRVRAKQLEFADPDGDAFLERVKRAPKDPVPPADPSPLVQFAIPRDVWSAVRLEAARYPHYDNEIVGPNHQLVTCGEASALVIVEQLARAGHKRTAARIRRTIRESRKARQSATTTGLLFRSPSTSQTS